MFFRLNPEIIITVGDKGSVLCDAFNNKVYHLNKTETEYLISAENNCEIDLDIDLYKNLEKERLGTFYDKIPYIHKIRKGSFSQTNDVEFSFKRFFLEINDFCNFSCDYCGNHSINKRSLGCLGCNIFNEIGSYLNLDDFYDIIDTIDRLGCEELYLTGGDISLNLELTKKVISYSRGKVDTIYLISSYKHDFSSLIDFLEEDVFLILQIDLKDLNKELINHENIIYLVIVPEDCENEFYTLVSDIGINCVPDFLTNKNNFNPNLDMNYEFNLDLFFHNLEFHPCLGKTLFISSKGNVYPCPLLRLNKWGKITDSFLNFLDEHKEKIYSFWVKNLDYIEGCNYCEFRYLCSDCRFIEEEISKEYFKKSLCSYKLNK